MSGYTVVNLKQIEDMAPKFGLAPNLEARFARSALGLEKTGLSYQKLAPNFRGPFAHTHVAQEEIYIVLGGSGRVKIEDDIIEVGPWDAVRVGPQAVRMFEAGSEGIELLAFGAPNTDGNNDAEVVQGWWTD